MMDDLDLLDAELIGAFGDNMLEAFAAAGTPSLSEVRAGKATIRKGMKGEPVKYVQQRAGLSSADVDGAFGDKTEAAVKRIQAAMDIGADGVVDRATLVALDSLTPYRIYEKAPTPAAAAAALVPQDPRRQVQPPPTLAPADDTKRNQIIAGVLAALAVLGIGVAVTRH